MNVLAIDASITDLTGLATVIVAGLTGYWAWRSKQAATEAKTGVEEVKSEVQGVKAEILKVTTGVGVIDVKVDEYSGRVDGKLDAAMKASGERERERGRSEGKDEGIAEVRAEIARLTEIAQAKAAGAETEKSEAALRAQAVSDVAQAGAALQQPPDMKPPPHSP